MVGGMKTLRCFRVNLLFLVTACLLSPLSAQPARPADSARHSLWKVEGKRNTVYLLGSVHVLKAENYPLPAAMESAYTNAAMAVFETDIDSMNQAEVQVKILNQARLPEGETLSQQLSPAVYKVFSNHLQEAGLPVEMFSQFKPTLAAITLAVLEMQKLGFDPEYGLDKHFYARAQKDAKRIVPLETVDFQIGLVTGFSKEEGEMMMKSTLQDIDQLKKEFPELLRAWQTGDSANLEKMLNEASHEAPVVFKRLVTDRNQRWLPKIEEWLQGEQNVIVIVGAGHLVGDGGIVEMLRKKGRKVTQQ